MGWREAIPLRQAKRNSYDRKVTYAGDAGYAAGKNRANTSRTDEVPSFLLIRLR